MSIYAVTGASGQLGRLAVQELLARDVPAADVVAVVRTPGKAADLADRGVQVRAADYSRPETLAAALADDTTNPLAAEHQGTEQALGQAGVPFTLLRNGWYTENYTGQLAQYLGAGEILGAAGHGRISAASRQDYAVTAAVALLADEPGNLTYELGGPAFDLSELARVITEVTGTKVTYHDLPAEEYAGRLQQAGLDEGTAHFVAALDTSIARGDLETSRQDLAQLLARPPIPLPEVVAAAHQAG